MVQRPKRTDAPLAWPGHTRPAGADTSNEEMARQVASQTSSDRMAEEVFRREHDGALTDKEAAKSELLHR
ncbi:hypothetical protein MXD61_03575 [Frankia sp. AgPm24]|uniref:Uncharacterized protein n=1 Tax=Frankia umida TaxID=573489 RepID=A0ABT0JRS1_9ACTN|nr:MULTISPECIES: hypothetical protein [Frankia]MCK9874226.1 hypothetical protein [Frankia umida]MCK9920995.1 hypothetical protein [Frankia sp. AgPm24]